ncbi:TetR/AcrR family transcriptional regulator [Paracidovorax konjaci]|uniref:DNA-binding transcriptional regulator, AcrR family n=1 Tax=Paracidovorax konjaci TaxID=32040 RepID=A0A1I1Y6Q8_9BURK|nr:TetR/AcrR family transcriptional regulator [Paracidovorax konjaci]SFE15246.1 DNA-binding transcriptional regulator, AcrR family [Paracidovorax konjaci]
MTTSGATTRLRPGGRSARVQAAVHQAVRDLTALHGREALTIPQIAARAGVTPSTIYRRWGDLVELLADVSIERLRDEAEPPDTGSVRGDLLAWGEQFLEEMSSELGRQVLKDVLTASGYGDGSAPCQCLQITAGQITLLVGRARSRGQATPSVDCVLDTLVAPVIYRLLMGAGTPTGQQLVQWVDACMAQAGRAEAEVAPRGAHAAGAAVP